jgi:hypothetical protein
LNLFGQDIGEEREREHNRSMYTEIRILGPVTLCSRKLGLQDIRSGASTFLEGYF